MPKLELFSGHPGQPGDPIVEFPIAFATVDPVGPPDGVHLKVYVDGPVPVVPVQELALLELQLQSVGSATEDHQDRLVKAEARIQYLLQVIHGLCADLQAVNSLVSYLLSVDQAAREAHSKTSTPYSHYLTPVPPEPE